MGETAEGGPARVHTKERGTLRLFRPRKATAPPCARPLYATRVRGVSCDDEGLVVDVVPTTRIARCSGCMCRVRAVHDRRERDWRHLDVGPFRVWLRYAMGRSLRREARRRLLGDG